MVVAREVRQREAEEVFDVPERQDHGCRHLSSEYFEPGLFIQLIVSRSFSIRGIASLAEVLPGAGEALQEQTFSFGTYVRLFPNWLPNG